MAIIKTPHKSDRAIAKQFKIGVMTVARARASVPNGTVEKRRGSDGKLRRMPLHKVPRGRKGPGIPVSRDERYPGLYRLQTAWMMATEQEGQMFLQWVNDQQNRRSCNVVELQRTAAQSR
jgi:hypothetical protein